MTWLLRLFALLGLLSLSLAHPLTAISTTDDISIRNIDQPSNDTTLDTPDDGFHLDKRGIAKYSTEEQKALRTLASGIDELLDDGDVVFFVGNSGS
jgi:hypothetical protein